MRDVITVTGLALHAHHGVFEHEKTDGQLFVVDLEVKVDSRRASTTDALSDTVNYAALIDTVAEVVTGESVDLIETLAHRIASTVLDTFPVHKVKVTVRKPHAPVNHQVTDISFTIKRTREEKPDV
jgi:dihydroneopterin aldolase